MTIHPSAVTPSGRRCGPQTNNKSMFGFQVALLQAYTKARILENEELGWTNI